MGGFPRNQHLVDKLMDVHGSGSGRDAAFFSFAVILDKRIPPTYFSRLLIVLAQSKNLRGATVWRLLRAVRSYLANLKLTPAQRLTLIETLHRYAIDYDDGPGKRFLRGSILKMIYDIAKHPRLSLKGQFDGVFGAAQLAELATLRICGLDKTTRIRSATIPTATGRIEMPKDARHTSSEDRTSISHSLVLSKHSGRAAFRNKLTALGYGDLGKNSLNNAFGRFKDLASRKQIVYDDDIIAIVDDEVRSDDQRIKFDSMELSAGSKTKSRAFMELYVDGDARSAEAFGESAVDATFNAIRAIFPHQAELKLFSVGAVTEGQDAQARCTVRLEQDGNLVDGQGADKDTIVAAARAYLDGLNKLLVKCMRKEPVVPLA